ncbi:MAG TPA: aerial mycelium formation protein [Actinomycetota bacterium]|nr:aerial mycelium formation protein [Actinomycetota bacterium]
MAEATEVPIAGGKRRIDRILEDSFVEGLGDLEMDELRRRRDLSRAEREYLSLVRRLLHGRRDILQAELERRRGNGGSVLDRLPEILADDPGPSRGEAPTLAIPDEELTLARRRVERLLADVALSDLENISDADLETGLARLDEEERSVSEARSRVLAVHDALQDELKERYRVKVRDLED